MTSGETYSIATDINNNGEIVGYSYSGALEPDGGSGIAWRSLNGSVPQEFADPGTIPLSINDNGNISGRIREGNKSVPAYHTSYSGFYDSLKILNGSTPSVRAGYAWCINSRGEIVGVNESQQDGLYWENYESTPIPESQITTHTQSIARAINSSGWIVGSGENAGGSRKALLWKPSGSGWSEQTISSSNALACSINQLGEAVGYSNSSAFYFNGTRTDLPRLGFGSAANHNDEPGQVDYDIRADAALDINDNGWIVGDSMVNSSSWRACIWRKDAGGTYRVTDLNSLIPAGSGWTLHSAKAINNRGQIVGYGSYAGSTRRAFLLTPTR